MSAAPIAQGLVDVTVSREWLDWPTDYGYWWLKRTPESEPEMVSVQPAKDGHVLTLWECSGIGRINVSFRGAARYQQVLPANVEFSGEGKRGLTDSAGT